MVKIGSNSSTLRSALSAHYDEHIISSDAFYHAVDLPAESIPDDLSEMLLERMLPRILINAIADSDAETTEEKEYLADAVSSEVIQNGSAERFRMLLASAIRDMLSEGSRINIEGLLYFRLRRNLSDFCRDVAKCTEKHRERYKKNRLLQKLNNYVRERTPHTKFLKVIGNASSYHLCDADGRIVRCIFSEEYTPEEHLLNSLLYLSPACIDLSGLNHPELKSVLEEIFSDRLI